MKSNIDVSIVIPCYNEMQVIEENVPRVEEIIQSTRFTYEIILYDDGSTDGTREVGREIASKSPHIIWRQHEKNKGRGATVTDGLRLSRGRIVGYLDMDLESPAEYLLPLVLEIEKGADVVIASRLEHVRLGELPLSKRPFAILYWLLRAVLSTGYSFLVRHLLNVHFRDTEAGFKFFSRDAILPLLDRIEDDHWFWDTEVMVRAYYSGLKIVEYPSLFLKNPEKSSTVKIFSDSVLYFKNILHFKKQVLPGLKNDSRGKSVAPLFDIVGGEFDGKVEIFDAHVEQMGRICKPCLGDWDLRGKKVLDAGCGTGSASIYFAGKGAGEVWGVDQSGKSLEVGRKMAIRLGYDRVSFEKGDMTSLPFGNGTFDLVFSCGVLPYIDDFRKGMDELLRVTSDSGIIVLLLLKKTKIDFFFNLIRGCLSRIPSAHQKRVSKIMALAARPIAELLLGRDKGSPAGKPLQQTLLEAFFSPVRLKKCSVEEMNAILSPRGFSAREITGIEGVDFYSTQTSFLLRVERKNECVERKSDCVLV